MLTNSTLFILDFYIYILLSLFDFVFLALGLWTSKKAIIVSCQEAQITNNLLATQIPYSAEYTRPRTPKNPEGRLYLGVIISKTERCRAASGIPELAVTFVMAGKSRVHAY